MKKTLTLLSIILIIAFAPEKEYKFTEGEAVATFQYFEITEGVLLNSDLPSKRVQGLLKTADSIKKVIALQYQKFNADTTKKK